MPSNLANLEGMNSSNNYSQYVEGRKNVSTLQLRAPTEPDPLDIPDAAETQLQFILKLKDKATNVPAGQDQNGRWTNEMMTQMTNWKIDATGKGKMVPISMTAEVSSFSFLFYTYSNTYGNILMCREFKRTKNSPNRLNFRERNS